MSNEFTSAWWTIELPPDWSAEREESCTSIWSEDGVGAIQISSYQHDGEGLQGSLKHTRDSEREYGIRRHRMRLICEDGAAIAAQLSSG